jgi:hypothetical protein
LMVAWRSACCCCRRRRDLRQLEELLRDQRALVAHSRKRPLRAQCDHDGPARPDSSAAPRSRRTSARR